MAGSVYHNDHVSAIAGARCREPRAVACCGGSVLLLIIIKEIYIVPFRHAPKVLCKQKVKC